MPPLRARQARLLIAVTSLITVWTIRQATIMVRSATSMDSGMSFITG